MRPKSSIVFSEIANVLATLLGEVLTQTELALWNWVAARPRAKSWGLAGGLLDLQCSATSPSGPLCSKKAREARRFSLHPRKRIDVEVERRAVHDEHHLVAVEKKVTHVVVADTIGIEAAFDVMRHGGRIRLLIYRVRPEVGVIGERRMIVGAMESHELHRHVSGVVVHDVANRVFRSILRVRV